MYMLNIDNSTYLVTTKMLLESAYVANEPVLTAAECFKATTSL